MKERAKKRKIASAKPKVAAKPKPRPRPVVKQAPAKVEPPKPVSRARYSKEDLAHFKSIILEKKKEIAEELETLRDTMMDSQTGEYATENSTYSTHMEQGTDAMEREKTFMFASREGKFLNYLEDALVRIEKGEYGRCTVCSKLIEKERLEAVPHAQQCVQCKMKMRK
ncbi:MAG: TraR/DksA C4-type zinc finger protein [Ignavibacteriales bacterium]|nr:TraR/DksA C4-type zinc finger protein [Ignavibacteriales bacterium]